jgi:hypothetical protein
MRACIQEFWDPKNRLMNLTFRLKVEPKLEDWYFKLGLVFSLKGNCQDLVGK